MNASMKVPRRLVWHVTTRVAADDQPTYWRLFWHTNRCFAGRLAERVTVAVTAPCLVGFSLWVQDWTDMLIACLGWALSMYLLRRRWKRHEAAIVRIHAMDRKKWYAIGMDAIPICEACEPDAPTEEGTITLPGDA